MCPNQYTPLQNERIAPARILWGEYVQYIISEELTLQFILEHKKARDKEGSIALDQTTRMEIGHSHYTLVVAVATG